MEGRVEINGRQRTLCFSGRDTLLLMLREAGFTEVKQGCGEGQCGACLVLLDGKLVNACQVFAASAVGKAVTTIKGLGNIHSPHPIQTAFVEAGAVQCGFCTPGMILAAYTLLRDNAHPETDDIKQALDGNLCRCTGYAKIIDAVKLAAERMQDDA